MSIIDYIQDMASEREKYRPEELLYKRIMDNGPYDGFMESEKLGEDMQTINQRFGQFWKTRYLLNHATQCAYEFINSMCILQHVADEDIDWDSIQSLPESALSRARNHDARYPSFIGKFENGVAQVSWQLHPDGRFYMDEDGYGITDDEEINIYGYINTSFKVLVKFRSITSYDELKQMKSEAIKVNSIKE